MFDLSRHKRFGIFQERVDASLCAEINLLATKHGTWIMRRVFDESTAGGFVLGGLACNDHSQTRAFLNRKLLLTTNKLLKAIAPAASIGFKYPSAAAGINTTL